MEFYDIWYATGCFELGVFFKLLYLSQFSIFFQLEKGPLSRHLIIFKTFEIIKILTLAVSTDKSKRKIYSICFLIW